MINPTLPFDTYLLEEQSCQISSQSNLKCLNKNKKNKIGSNVRSVPDPKGGMCTKITKDEQSVQ